MQILDAVTIASPLWLLLGLGLGIARPWSRLIRLGSSSEPLLPIVTATTDATTIAAVDPSIHQELAELRSQLAQTQLAYRMVVEISQFRAGYLSRSAHELRSPLNSLIGIHQMILADLCDDPAEEREFIAQASESALRLVNLMDRVIDVSKADYGSEPIQLRPLQLSRILEEVDELSRLQAQNRNLTLQIELPNPDIYVLADLPRFRQVLLNLVDTPLCLMQDGRVCLTVHVDSEYVYIDIEDDRPVELWQEPVDWLHQYQQQGVNLATPELSPGLTIVMDQILLETMGGRLELLAIPSTESAEGAVGGELSAQPTRIQCVMPRVTSN